MRGLPGDRGTMGALAHLSDMRPRRLLRLVSQSPRHRSLSRHAPPRHHIRRGRRDVGVLLPGRSRPLGRVRLARAGSSCRAAERKSYFFETSALPRYHGSGMVDRSASLTACALVMAVVAACGSGGSSDAGGKDASTPDASGAGVRVVTHNAVAYPHYGSIQAAVDAAKPGDFILIDIGTYDEQVAITTPMLHLRGMDRNRVVVDGQHQVGDGILVSKADGVTIENLTVHDFDRTD